MTDAEAVPFTPEGELTAVFVALLIQGRKQGYLTPDDLLDGRMPADPVVIFDDDHYYLGAVLAEKLAAAGRDVTLVTPAAMVSAWTINTLEQFTIQRRLLELGVRIVLSHNLVEFAGQRVALQCVYTARPMALPASTVVTVTARLPNAGLHEALRDCPEAVAAAGIRSINSIGDCLAPASIAAAVYAGHRYAREFDRPAGDEPAFRRELAH